MNNEVMDRLQVINVLTTLHFDDIIPEEDVAALKLKGEKLKEQEVLKLHKNKITARTRIKNGKPYDFYETRYGAGSVKKMRCHTYQEIIAKLYDYYFSGKVTIPTLNEAFEQMIKQKREYKSVEEMTLVHYKADWDRYILGRKLDEKEIKNGKIQYRRFNRVDSPIDKITKTDILNLYEYLVGDNNITLKTFNNIKSVVNAAFAYAGNLDGVNCLKTAELSTSHIAKRCRDVDNSSEVFSDEDRNILLSYLESITQTVYTLAIRLMFCLTTRIGELKALTWDDVDFDNKKVYIRHQIVYKPGNGKKRTCSDVDHMKSRSRAGKREFPLSDYAIEVLKALKEINGNRKYVLNSNGKNPIETNKFNEHLRDYCLAAGITPRSSHKIRFWACTTLYSENVDEKTTQSLMGHSDLQTTHGYDRRKNNYNIPDETLQTKFGRK